MNRANIIGFAQLWVKGYDVRGRAGKTHSEIIDRFHCFVNEVFMIQVKVTSLILKWYIECWSTRPTSIRFYFGSRLGLLHLYGYTMQMHLSLWHAKNASATLVQCKEPPKMVDKAIKMIYTKKYWWHTFSDNNLPHWIKLSCETFV